MFFMNNTETIGVIINTGSSTLTGSIMASIFLLLIFLIVVSLMFGIPLEFLAIIVLPFCLSVGAYYSDFMIPIIVIIVYLSMLIAKNWLFR